MVLDYNYRVKGGFLEISFFLVLMRMRKKEIEFRKDILDLGI